MFRNMWIKLKTCSRTMCNVTALQNIRKTKTVLTSVHEDLSLMTPSFPNTFNIAAYVNSSDTLKKLIDLNVNLSKIEKKPYLMEKLLKLDFETDMKQHLFFIYDYVEDPAQIGAFITKNPMIFFESLDNLQIRINYLLSKKFSIPEIKTVIMNNPFWLNFSSVRIDRRLGFYQEHFHLNGSEVRTLSTLQPKIITYNLHHIKTNSFVVKEEMGFTDDEVKTLVMKKPKLWLLSQKSLLQRFNYIHNEIKIPHSTILLYPQILECRNFKVKQRHSFLSKLGRAQYNPKKENYVPIMALAEGTDVEFCFKYAKCMVSDYNTFLKTLC